MFCFFFISDNRLPAHSRKAQSGAQNMYRQSRSTRGMIKEQLTVGGTVYRPVTQRDQGLLETHPHGSLAEMGEGLCAS